MHSVIMVLYHSWYQ